MRKGSQRRRRGGSPFDYLPNRATRNRRVDPCVSLLLYPTFGSCANSKPSFRRNLRLRSFFPRIVLLLQESKKVFQPFVDRRRVLAAVGNRDRVGLDPDLLFLLFFPCHRPPYLFQNEQIFFRSNYSSWRSTRFCRRESE